MKKLSIVIPAHNEQNRITRTLQTYVHYFDELQQKGELAYEIIVVNNGSRDATATVVAQVAQQHATIRLLNFTQAGKGFAVAAGFKDALTRHNDYIGYVDADMATQPQYLHAVVPCADTCDGLIASRYMQGSVVAPPRPWIKYWGSRLVYDNLVRLLFGMHYHDYQCGAKVFKRRVVEVVTPDLTVAQWAFDVELLYLCKKYGFTLQEIPTVWHDQAGSQLRIMRSGMKMLGAVIAMRFRHSTLSGLLRTDRL